MDVRYVSFIMNVEQQIKREAKKVMGRYSAARMTAVFGTPMRDVVTIWTILFNQHPQAQLQHLLWSLYFLKTYPTEVVGSAAWGIDTKTFLKHVRNTVCLLNISLPDV